MLVMIILRLRSFLISLNWSLIAGFGGEHFAPKSEARLHVPRKRGLKRPQSTKLQTNGLYLNGFQNHTIVYGTTSTEQTGQENPGSAPAGKRDGTDCFRLV